MTTPDTEPQAKGKRRGIVLYGPDNATPLYDTGMMSMPTMTPAPTDQQLMDWALSNGHVVKTLFEQKEANGMSLVWSWFAPGYTLPRHSHSADCLYYVLKGEIRLGNRTVAAGSGFFVPEDAPYAYSAGDDGVEVLEFRGVSFFDMKITESLPRWEQIAAGARESNDAWSQAKVTAGVDG
jgi:quercetin dioxygenase-like cupin family protein